MKLIRNMHNMGDDRIYSVSSQTGKENPPFVGIIVMMNNRQYCIPLSSPKAKHKTMKNSLDFHRILDSDGKLIGVLNFNNMIPVRDDVIQKIQLKINEYDSASNRHYKNLMIDQITYCRKNQAVIVRKAQKLHRLVNMEGASSQLKRRCLKWTKLEAILDRFDSQLS